jgi:hypothetical protein
LFDMVNLFSLSTSFKLGGIHERDGR